MFHFRELAPWRAEFYKEGMPASGMGFVPILEN